ncbi:MAG: ABC transporter substrate-binding protein, partial [Trueperaceae bacterium]
DPDNFMHTFYADTGYFTAENGFTIPGVEELDAKARTSTDPAEREALYSEIANLAYEYSAYILLPQTVPYLVMSDKIQGVYNNPNLSESFLWKDISKN